MIYDLIANLNSYRGLSANMDKAIDFLQTHALEALPDGRIDIDGDEVYASVSRLTCKPASQLGWEAHKQYADIQISFTGGETVGYLPYDLLSWGQYKPDFQQATANPDGLALPLEKGRFAILFPQDAHRPGEGKGDGRKIVVKVKL